MEKYVIDNNLAKIGYYGADIAFQINKAVSEILADLNRESANKNAKIKIDECHIEVAPFNKKKKNSTRIYRRRH
jgi:hypothetical protein